MNCHRSDNPQSRYGIGQETDYILCPRISIRRHIDKKLCEDCHYYVDFVCKYREMYNPIKNGIKNDKKM
jgi:hypothetical protein